MVMGKLTSDRSSFGGYEPKTFGDAVGPSLLSAANSFHVLVWTLAARQIC
jgi:hypothetical protein